MPLDLVFHNAYGPGKPWFYDKAQSGDGCVMDLGVHLVDLALWVLGFPDVLDVTSHLSAEGHPLDATKVEDYAVATLILEGGTIVRLACSWRLHAGVDAVIAADFYGTDGGASLRNVGGSFHDFIAERVSGTCRELLTTTPDEWGGRAGVQWARKLEMENRFEPFADELVLVAAVLDLIYSSSAKPAVSFPLERSRCSISASSWSCAKPPTIIALSHKFEGLMFDKPHRQNLSQSVAYEVAARPRE